MRMGVSDDAKTDDEGRKAVLLISPSVVRPLSVCRQMAWNGCSFTDATRPWNTSLTGPPARQLLHVVEPALDIRIGREVAANDFAERHQSGAEIVGDRDLVAAQILVVRADPVVVEDFQPALGVLLADLDGGRLRLVAAPLLIGEQLRIGEIVGPVAIEIGVEPIHHLVDLGALLQILRIGRRADLVGEIFQDRRAFGQLQVAVFDHRHEVVRIDRRIGRPIMLAGEQVDRHLVDRNLVFGDEQPHRAARH